MLATHDHAGVTTDALLRQVWGRRGSDDTNRVRTVVKKLPRIAGRRRHRSSEIVRTPPLSGGVSGRRNLNRRKTS